MLIARLLRRNEGAAMVEMALVLPLFLLLVYGVIDFGRLLFTANSMATAVREGARRAAVLPGLGNAAPVNAVVKAAFTPFGSPPITDAEISIDTVTVPGSVIVKVTNYPWPTLTPLAALIGQNVSITRQATFRRERATG